jgi:hypothetical protein
MANEAKRILELKRRVSMKVGLASLVAFLLGIAIMSLGFDALVTIVGLEAVVIGWQIYVGVCFMLGITALLGYLWFGRRAESV